MTKRKGYMSLLLFGALSSAVMAGCSSNNGEEPAPSSSASNGSAASTPKEKVKVTFWTNARHDADLMQEKIKQFNESNKSNIEVEYQIMTDNYEQAVQTAIQAEEAPDIMNAKMKLKFEDLIKMKAIEPLDSYIGDDEKARFGDLLKMDRQNFLDGKTYSLPNYGTTWRLIYNKDLFDKAGIKEAPRSLDELVDDARKITEAGKADGAYGFAINMKTPSSAFERGLLPMVRLDGKDIYDWRTGKYTFESLKPYVEALKKIVDSKSMMPGFESLDIDPLRNQFAAGKIGMYFSLSAEPGVYKSQFPTQINWGVAQVPTMDGGAPKGANYINGGASWLYMSSQSKHKKETWEVMKFLYSDEVLVPYYEQGKGVSVVPSVISKAKAPELKNFQEFAPKEDVMWPPYLALNVEGKAWQNVIAESILGFQPIDKAIADLNKRYNDSLDKEDQAGGTKRIVIPDWDPASQLKK
ncbi:ABC transporter substrate-binding protein [Paenibacillus sp. D51F]